MSKRAICLWSLVLSIILLVGQYIIGNIPVSISGVETITLKRFESIKHRFTHHSYKENDSWLNQVTLINTSYSNQLYGVYEQGFPIGTEVRTSRKELYTLLKNLDSGSNYKYIVIDLLLDSIVDPYNDSLKVLLDKMENIVMAKTTKASLFSESFEKKAGMVDYYYTPEETGFVKFDLLNRYEKSLPLVMYNDIDGRTIKKRAGVFFFDGKKLCSRALIPNYRVLFISHEHIQSDKGFTSNAFIEDYINLGPITRNRSFIIDQCKNKIVVIGDFLETDFHDTYVGRVSGALINLNTYLSLTEERHIIRYCFIIALIVFYSIITAILFILTFSGENYPFFYRLANSSLSIFVASVLGWGFIFHMISLLVFITKGFVFNPWLPTLWFSLLSLVLKLSHKSIQSRHE